MRNTEKILSYVSSNKQHYLNVWYRGRFKKPQYTNSTICGSDEYGEGVANCVQELYLTEEVIDAFTCYYSDWNSDSYNNAMVCLTDNGRVIIGLEEGTDVFEYTLDDYDIKRMKLKRYVTESKEHERIVSVGMMNFMVKSFSTDFADEHVEKIIKIICNIARKYGEK